MTQRPTFAEFMLPFYSTYHNHKEVMAYSIFALEGAFFLGLFLLGNWPPSIQAFSQFTLASIFFLTWTFFHTALRFQLRNRKLAAIKVAACIEAITLESITKVDIKAVLPAPAGKIDELIDTYLLPTRNAFRASDVELSLDFLEIAPASVEAVAYYELKNKCDAQKSWTKYAIPMEWITTVGSLLMLVIVLIRVYG